MKPGLSRVTHPNTVTKIEEATVDVDDPQDPYENKTREHALARPSLAAVYLNEGEESADSSASSPPTSS